MERMDDFEMRFQKKYKEEIELIKPYRGLENRIEKGLDRPDIRYRWNKKPAVVLCSMVLLMIVCAGLLYNNALLKPDNAFIIYTYADDKRVDLKENEEVTLPSGKYIESNGEREFRGNNHFYIEGDRIKSVHLQSKNGTIMYFDKKKQEDLERNGELYVAKILLDPEKYHLTFPFHYQDFKNLWDSGMLNEYKEKYFKEMSTDLSEYEVGIQTSANNGKLDYAEFIIQTKEQASNESNLYIKGKDVTLEYHKGYGLDPIWHLGDPREKNFISSISDLSQLSDTITMAIEFSDGEIKNYQIEKSFDDAGNMLIEYKTDDSE